VVVQGVPRFNVEQTVEMRPLSYVKENLNQLLRANHHFSPYLFPFVEECQINTWNRKEKDRTIVGRFLEFIDISQDALLAAWIGNLIAYLGYLPQSGRTYGGIGKGSDFLL